MRGGANEWAKMEIRPRKSRKSKGVLSTARGRRKRSKKHYRKMASKIFR